MALVIDGSTPAVATGTGAVTTTSFTPPDGSILVVAFSGNSTGGSNPSQPSITDNLGSHLTYTPVPTGGPRPGWWSRADGSPTIDGQCAMWTAPVATGAAMTVTVTNNAGSNEAAVRVWVITGQDPTTPIGDVGKAGSSSASSVAQSYTGQATSGQGFGVICDWDAKGAETAGTGCTLDDTGSVGGQFSYAFVRRTVDDDTLGSTNSLNSTLPGTSTNLSWVWVELLPVQVNQTLVDPPPFVASFPPGLFAPNGRLQPWLGAPDAPSQPISLAVTATEGGSTNNGIGLTVKVITGADLNQNGQFNSTGTITTPNLSITPKRSGSWVYGALLDDASSTVWAAHAGTTFGLNFSDATNTACYGTYRSTSTTTALTAVVLGADTPSATGGLAQAEIVPIGVLAEDVTSPPSVTATGAHTVSTITFTPPAGSLLVAMVAADGGAAVATMVVSGGPLVWAEVVKQNASGAGYVGVWVARVPGGTPIPPMVVQPSRRRPIPILRRPSRSTDLVPAQVTVAPPAYPPVGVRSHVKFWQAWRSHGATVVPPQVTPAPLSFVPQAPHPKLWAVLLRRPRTAAPPVGQLVPPQTTRGRLRAATVRKARTTAPVPPQVVLAAPAYPPQSWRSRIKGARLWRGRGATPVPPQVVLTPPGYVPQVARLRLRAARLGRPRTTTTVPAQAAVPARSRPAPILRAAPLARRRTPPVVHAQATPPLLTRIRVRVGQLLRGRRRAVVPAQVILIAPPRVSQSRAARTRMLAVKRRRVTDGWISRLCETPRPATGTTARPGSGTTAYALAATTRPNSGITSRPNTGTTSDPC